MGLLPASSRSPSPRPLMSGRSKQNASRLRRPGLLRSGNLRPRTIQNAAEELPLTGLPIHRSPHNSAVRRDTLIDFFNDLSRARGAFLAYDDGFRSRAYSYEDVGRAARGFAARLHEAGLRKGDKIVFWSENRPEWIVAFWGALSDA